MATRSNATVSPRLRFPEFREAEDWKMAPLDTIAERVATKNGDGEVTRVLTNSAEYGILDQRDYFDRDIATAGKVDGYYIVDVGDFVYNPRTSAIAPVGPISRNNLGKGVMSPLYTVFRFATAKTDFYEHFFKSTGWHSYLRRAASTGARHDRMSITPGAFMRMPVPTPHPAEQQEIADCLTSLDEVIVAQGRKVEALKTYKQGLMQRLFPNEGESLPRLRFPDFRGSAEWSRKSLSAISEVLKGKGISKADVVPSGNRPCIRYGELYTRYSEKIETVYSRTNVVETELLLSRKNDVIIPASGETKLEIAKASCVLVDGVALGGDLNVIRATCNGLFLSYYLNGPKRSEIARVAQGDTVVHLYPSQLQLLDIALPEEREQERIANLLSSIDAEISAAAEKLVALATHKKGLMQQLFPS